MPLRDALKALYGIDELPEEPQASSKRLSSSNTGSQTGLVHHPRTPANRPTETDPMTQVWNWAESNQESFWLLVLLGLGVVIGILLGQFF